MIGVGKALVQAAECGILFLPSLLYREVRHTAYDAVTTPVPPALIFLATPPGLRLYFLGSVSTVSASISSPDDHEDHVPFLDYADFRVSIARSR